jgi:hypothetical protein
MATTDALLAGVVAPPPSSSGSSSSGGVSGAATRVHLSDGPHHLVAIARGPCVEVLEASTLRRVATLMHGATVTAVQWQPAELPRPGDAPPKADADAAPAAADARAHAPARLATGDSEGGVVVWDVVSASVAARLEDALSAAAELSASAPQQQQQHHHHPPPPAAVVAAQRLLASVARATATATAAGPPVVGLAWVLPRPGVLAVALAPDLVLLFDAQANTVFWHAEALSLPQRALAAGVAAAGGPAAAGGGGPDAAAPPAPGGGESLTGACADPVDRRRLALCGSLGALVVLDLDDPSTGRVRVRRYRVGGGAPAAAASSSSCFSLQARFAPARDLLYVLLPRELLVFDLELGVPVASTALPAAPPPRAPGLAAAAAARQRPPPGSPAPPPALLSGAPFSHLLAVYGCGVALGSGDAGGTDFVALAHADGQLSVWRRRWGSLRYEPAQAWQLLGPPSSGAAAMVGACAAVVVAVDDGGGGGEGRRGSRQGEGGEAEPPLGLGPPRLGLVAAAAASDGRAWVWEQPRAPPSLVAGGYYGDGAPSSSSSSSAAEAPPLPLPRLVGVSHGLSSAAVAVAWHPRPLILPPPPPPPPPEDDDDSEDEEACAASAAATTNSLAPLAATVTADGALALLSVGRGAAQALEAEVIAEVSVHPPLQPAAGASAAPHGATAAAAAARPGASSSAARFLQSRALAIAGAAGIGTAGRAAGPHVVARGVRWIGSSAFVVVFSSERAAPPPPPGAGGAGAPSPPPSSAGAASAAASTATGFRNRLSLVDALGSRSALPFRVKAEPEAAPLAGVAASPSGAQLLLTFKGAPAELWAVPSAAAAATGAPAPASAAAAAPFRLRLLDLAFTAAEWVAVPADAAGGDREGRGDGGGGEAAIASADDFLSAAGPAAAAAASAPPAATAPSEEPPPPPMPEELLAFALRDGRCGVLSVRGRKVADTRPHLAPAPPPSAAPRSSGGGGGPGAAAFGAPPPPPGAEEGLLLGAAGTPPPPTSSGGGDDALLLPSVALRPGEFAATAVAAYGHVVLLGDERGVLVAWDTRTGACCAASVQGLSGAAVAAFALAPSCRSSGGAASSSSAGTLRFRAAVLSARGDTAVLEVEAAAAAPPGSGAETPPPSTADGGSGRGLPRLLAGGALPPGAAAAAAGAPALQLAWVALPQGPAGAILSAVTADGCIALLDAAPLPPPPPATANKDAAVSGRRARADAALAAARRARALRATVSRCPLPPPPPLASPALLPRAPVLLARLLMQLATPLDALDELAAQGGCGGAARGSSSSSPPPLSLLPPAVRRALASPYCRPRRSGSGFLGAALSPRPSVDGSLPPPLPEAASLGASPPSPAAGIGSASVGAEQAALAAAAAVAAVAQLRGGRLLLPGERRAYAAALRDGKTAARMAAAALTFGGDGDGGAEEARWWRLLPSTLASVAAAAEPTLWPPRLALQELRERAAWRDALPLPAAPARPAALSPAEAAAVASAASARAFCAGGGGGAGAAAVAAAADAAALVSSLSSSSSSSSSPLAPNAAAAAAAAASYASAVADADGQRERRLLDLVAVGDLQSAVAFLLSASEPEATARFYRSSVQALALGASASLAAQTQGGGGGDEGDEGAAAASSSSAATLHLQSAKLIGASAAAAGDGLLRAVLDASAGMHAEAVSALQDAGMWARAGALCARALPAGSAARARALRRWAQRGVLPSAGAAGAWRAAGLLASGGCLAEAAAALAGGGGRPDAAFAFVGACEDAGMAAGGSDGGGGGGKAAVAADFERHVLAVLQLLL